MAAEPITSMPALSSSISQTFEGSYNKRQELEDRLRTLLERESTRASDLSAALDSAAAVAHERDELIEKLKMQQRYIDELHVRLSEERKHGQSLKATDTVVQNSNSETVATNISSLQDHISMQNAELMKILRHLANAPLPAPENPQESYHMRSSTRYFKNKSPFVLDDNVTFPALISQVSEMQEKISYGDEALNVELAPRLQALKNALLTLQNEQQEEREASDIRHKLDTMTPSLSKGVRDLMVESFRPSSEQNHVENETKNIVSQESASGSHNYNEELTKGDQTRTEESEKLRRWKTHAEEVMDAMRMELSERITKNIELEKKNQKLEQEKVEISTQLNDSIVRINILEKAVTSLQATGAQRDIDNTYRSEMEAQMIAMQERFDTLKSKYLKQSKKTRELQVRMLQLTQNNEESHSIQSGDAIIEPCTQGAKQTDGNRGIVAVTSNSEPIDIQSQQLESTLENIERVPNEVLERIESLQDTRRRLYTAPSSQNRRPLPPEIPVPAEVLEAQRLTDEHRTELQSAPSSQLLKLIKHIDSWHDNLSDDHQVAVERPATAPFNRRREQMEAPAQEETVIDKSIGSVFVPNVKRNNFVGQKEKERQYLGSAGADRLHLGQMRQKRMAGQRVRFTSNSQLRPSSARLDTARSTKNSIKKKRPGSAPLAKKLLDTKDLKLIVHPDSTVDSGLLQNVTIPLTPHFTEIADCDHRRSCACKSTSLADKRNKIESLKFEKERILKPWK